MFSATVEQVMKSTDFFGTEHFVYCLLTFIICMSVLAGHPKPYWGECDRLQWCTPLQCECSEGIWHGRHFQMVSHFNRTVKRCLCCNLFHRVDVSSQDWPFTDMLLSEFVRICSTDCSTRRLIRGWHLWYTRQKMGQICVSYRNDCGFCVLKYWST